MDGHIFACFVVALVIWMTICLLMRYTLKLLLMYKGFMFETRGKGVSLPTKAWAALVKGENKTSSIEYLKTGFFRKFSSSGIRRRSTAFKVHCHVCLCQALKIQLVDTCDRFDLCSMMRAFRKLQSEPRSFQAESESSFNATCCLRVGGRQTTFRIGGNSMFTSVHEAL